MPVNVRFHPEADREFKDAFNWYDHQRKGLGAEFFLCVDESIERIQNNPQLYPLVYNNIRRAVVRRFPFAVFYEVEESEIRVIGVFHSRRDPDQWKSRK
jgi:plasmid stabilization system protein ParE